MLIRFAGLHAVVIKSGLKDDFLHGNQVIVERFLITIGNLGWFDKDRCIALHVDKTDRPSKSELDLLGIEQVKRCHVMLSESQMLKTAFEFVGSDKKSETMTINARWRRVSANSSRMVGKSVSP